MTIVEEKVIEKTWTNGLAQIVGTSVALVLALVATRWGGVQSPLRQMLHLASSREPLIVVYSIRMESTRGHSLARWCRSCSGCFRERRWKNSRLISNTQSPRRTDSRLER